MIKKAKLRQQAIAMRKKGVTYGGIMDKIPVAKSTLALWFKEVKLSVPQVQEITKARLEAGKRGGLARKSRRIRETQKIIDDAEKEVGCISLRELWLIGTTIYWAEGSKEKEWGPGSSVSFINMDPHMVKTFLKWLRYCCVKPEDIRFEIYIHENSKSRLNEIKKYWAKVIEQPVPNLKKVYWKKGNIKPKRKRVGANYYGIIKVCVKQSSAFLRKIAGWTNGIYKGINIEQ